MMRYSPRGIALACIATALLMGGIILIVNEMIRLFQTTGGLAQYSEATPIVGQTEWPTPWSIVPDTRIADLQSHGINLVNLKCTDICRGDVIPSVPLDTFVKAMGVPSKVGSFTAGPDFVVILIYGEKGMLVYAARPIASDVVNMTPAMRVDQMLLYRARTLEDLEVEAHSRFQQAQDWTGFGPVRPLPR